MRTVKNYEFNGLSGCVVQRKSRITKTIVSVYENNQAGLDSEVSWSTVCEFHGTIMGHNSLHNALAWLANPTEWCEDCRATPKT